MVNRRNSYTTKQKLEEIKFAKENNNYNEAARQLNVNESTIRKWIKNKRFLMKLNPKKRALRRGKPKWPELEKKVKEYVLEMKRQKLQVSTLYYISQFFIYSWWKL